MDMRHAAALDRAISTDRLATYLSEAGGDPEHARELYVWDRDLAAALLADIAIVEVALRNAVNDALTNRHGQRWFTKDIGLDDRSRSELASAWRRAPGKNPLPGRVVAQLMLGFWVNLLDSGGTVGRSEPQSFRMNYEDLWRDCVHQAFRGGRAVANQRQEQFTRSWTHEIASTVQTVRNRCAHHEPLLRGIPLPGQNRRISAQEGYDAYVLLLRIINQDLATWVESNSAVATVLARRPQP